MAAFSNYISHYSIIEKLGAGGMGEVYLAQDTRLGRKVAIKLLPPESMGNEQAKRRLLREARAAATLDHPNICAVHEVGEEAGQTFIVMQYVEGETLAARLKRQRLDLEEAVSIATQVADALSEAHAHGIIHRDLKPQNIMCTGRGRVRVLDFGLAKLIREPATGESEAETVTLLTSSGVVMGTVPYMSPEQVRGEQLDERSDIFSFGVLVYEMVSGRQPFLAPSAAEIVSAILTRDVTPLDSCVPDVPLELARLTRKCLEKDRARRYQTMREVVIDLESVRRELESGRITEGAKTDRTSPVAARAIRPRALTSRATVVVTILLILMIAALAYRFFWHGAAAPRHSQIKSLAVLPLDNLSEESSEYFADGMTEAVISNLAQIRALRVISRTSVMHYKHSGMSVPEIARELKVDAVISGSVQRAGGRVRVTAQLIDAPTDTHLWARDYERDLTDVLKLQSEIARAIADEIRVHLTVDESSRLASAPRIDPQAHEAYLLGRYHLRSLNETDLKQAIDHFERATKIAPDYAAAYAGLAAAWLERGIWGAKTFREVEPDSRAAASKAVSLDEQLGEAHLSLAQLKFIYDWDWSGAESEFKYALELDPGSLYVHSGYAFLLMALGRHDEAIRQMQIAEQLDPLSAETQSGFGRVLYRARKYEEAIQHLNRAIELEPRNYTPYVRLIDVYAQMGKYDDAIAAFKKANVLRPDDRPAIRLARVYALMGRAQEARAMIPRMKTANLDFETAALYAVLGEDDAAFRILEKAAEQRSSLLVYIKEDPSFDSLHSDPRWEALLRRMNFRV